MALQAVASPRCLWPSGPAWWLRASFPPATRHPMPIACCSGAASLPSRSWWSPTSCAATTRAPPAGPRSVTRSTRAAAAGNSRATHVRSSARRMAIDAEVCIVGAGPAGALVAAELVRREIPTVLIEAGPRHDPAQRAEYARQLLAGVDPWRTAIPDMDGYTTGGATTYPLQLHRTRGVGGGTLHWEGYAIRFHADDFRLRARHGVADDWPISYETLEPYYARAERALGVAGAADDPWASPRSAAFPLPPFPLSYSDQLLARAVRRLDVAIHHLPQARNSIAYDGRPQCSACS